MTSEQNEDTRIYKVVVNHEEQYSIWPTHKEIPSGWRDGGREGPKRDCLAYIEQVWTDMRPLSLRRKLEEMASSPAPAALPADDQPLLVDRLSRGEHNLEFSSRLGKTPATLRERIDSGYLHVRFPDTRGGTELGVRLIPDDSDLTGGDFERGTGEVLLVGSLILDETPVRCVARIDLATLAGKGHLEAVR
jgi:uncharacterized protein YbdZ (MbtH family)